MELVYQLFRIIYFRVKSKGSYTTSFIVTGRIRLCLIEDSSLSMEESFPGNIQVAFPVLSAFIQSSAFTQTFLLHGERCEEDIIFDYYCCGKSTRSR